MKMIPTPQKCGFVLLVALMLCLLLSAGFVDAAKKQKNGDNDNNNNNKKDNSAASTPLTTNLLEPPSPAPVDVWVRTNLIDVMRLIEKDIRFSATTEIQLSWIDQRLDSRPSSLDLVWTPDIDFANALKLDFSNPVRWVFNNESQTMTWTRNIVSFWSSKYDFEKFPFDSQELVFIFRSRARSKDDPPVRLRSRDRNNDLLANKNEFHIVEWSIGDADVETEIREDEFNFKFSEYKFRFYLEREYVSYITQNIVPASFMVFLSWTGFYMGVSRDRVMPRLMPIIFSTVAIVNVNVFTASILPRSSKFTLLEAFAVFNLLLILLCLIEFVTIHYFERSHKHRVAKAIDHTARYAFPGAYIYVNGGLLVRYLGESLAGTLVWFLVGGALYIGALIVKAIYEVRISKD